MVAQEGAHAFQGLVEKWLGGLEPTPLDVERAKAFEPLIKEGYAASLVEAGFRFALGTDTLSTVLIGCSDLGHLEFAAAAAAKGPLPAPAMDRLRAIWPRLAA